MASEFNKLSKDFLSTASKIEDALKDPLGGFLGLGKGIANLDSLIGEALSGAESTLNTVLNVSNCICVISKNLRVNGGPVTKPVTSTIKPFACILNHLSSIDYRDIRTTGKQLNNGDVERNPINNNFFFKCAEAIKANVRTGFQVI
jgi:hypothetical protein